MVIFEQQRLNRLVLSDQHLPYVVSLYIHRVGPATILPKTLLAAQHCHVMAGVLQQFVCT